MKTIYFPRYQRAFLATGRGVGSHPLFRHLHHPPEGFRFISTPISWPQRLARFPVQSVRLCRRWHELRHLGRSVGLSAADVGQFIRTRGLSRIVPAPWGTVATFLPGYPLTHLNEDWFVEIEDTTTLLDPYVLNGRTSQVKFHELRALPLIRHLLESPRCLGILTHVRSTQAAMARLFRSETIARKTGFLPLAYLPIRPVAETDLESGRADRPLRFFFNNSWHQGVHSFFLRGGVSVLECFEQLLARKYPVTLVLRSALPPKIQNRFASLLSHPNIEVIDRFMTAEEYVGLLRSSHYFLLPSARIHTVSLLEAMYYGTVPIVSDGWAIQEYVEDRVTGHVVPGVSGIVSWDDPETGALQEDYEPMYRIPGLVTEALLQCVTALLDGPDGRAGVALRAHRRVRDDHGIERFNRGFGPFLERGLQNLAGAR